MADEEPMEACPFDPGHQIQRSRMPYHVIRCRKNHPNVKLKICPYDSRHEMNESHLESCPAKELVQQTISLENDDSVGIMPMQAFTLAREDPVETFSDEDNSPSILQTIQGRTGQDVEFAAPKIGSSKNQRKSHRLEQRRLVQEREAAADSNQKENKKQENKKSQNKKETAKTVLQSRINEKNSSDDLGKKREEVEPVEKPSNPDVKPEVEVLKISALTIDSEKDITTSKIQNSGTTSNPEPKVCAFSYAAALSGKNKQNTNVTGTGNATNLNSFLKTKVGGSRK